VIQIKTHVHSMRQFGFSQKKNYTFTMPLGKALGSENTLQAFSFQKKNLTQ